MPSKKRRKNRGKIVWDESADARLKPHVQLAGWELILMKQTDRGIGMKDPVMLKRYAKGKHPVFTSDRTCYFENPVSEGATGFVLTESFGKKDAPIYSAKVQEFMSSITTKNTNNKVWVIHKDKEPSSKKLKKKKE